MKNYIHLFMGLWLASVGSNWFCSPCLSRADQAGASIGELPNGYIDWSQGTLNIKESFFWDQADAEGTATPAKEKAKRAHRRITPIVMQNLALLRIDARQHVSDLMQEDAGIRDKLNEMATAAPFTTYTEQGDGSVVIGVQIRLNGALAQLILPSDIKQVETIKAVSNDALQADSAPYQLIAHGKPATEPDVYTGLIVDARGIGAQPALAPVLLDENGKEVYSAAFISREYAVHNGICQYIRTIDNAGKQRIGSKPLMVKGLRTVSGRICDIVISNADASRLHGVSAHLAFLKECRVIIVLD